MWTKGCALFCGTRVAGAGYALHVAEGMGGGLWQRDRCAVGVVVHVIKSGAAVCVVKIKQKGKKKIPVSETFVSTFSQFK